MQIRPTIQIDNTKLKQFCYRWQIQTLDMFGSVPREDFSPESDIELLVTFAPDVRCWTG